ncbi:hypothetical protein P4493_04290 [Bacillus thuringiensis]|jgi:hypothetical protein|uniref:Uncharacterized protein n=3 Tax=Bacillus thuringiensis TaxID=1428 RepID=A0A0B5NKB5_BACTU|nr:MULTISPECIES: hypothetical protein [Bacillus]EAO52921.1 hypothetical protein RBTH_08363 [Bacillus thuringiensis serovar israelensis ATCC 35646]MEC2535496.1 hypothetical protein [Bacillus cereus]MED1153790.1 hypothetical protein [Bacillus paranthracis]OUB09348.1 hypothetical protein BK708_33025 [Bacillus thuringiensis serovar yunnanensis]AFQ30102.1 hypothetical protein BTF1_30007 [Bacillus thuringiensis HD-789]
MSEQAITQQNVKNYARTHGKWFGTLISQPVFNGVAMGVPTLASVSVVRINTIRGFGYVLVSSNKEIIGELGWFVSQNEKEGQKISFTS